MANQQLPKNIKSIAILFYCNILKVSFIPNMILILKFAE